MMDENSENPSTPLSLQNSQVFKKSILKPSQHDNLIQLCTPVHKGLKVKFETPHNVKKSTPTRFEGIRMLDEKENWIERTSIVTKAQHEEYLAIAQDIMLEIINKLPLDEKVKEETLKYNQESQDKVEEDVDGEDFYDAVMEIEENAKEHNSTESTTQSKVKDEEEDGTQSVKEEAITAEDGTQSAKEQVKIAEDGTHSVKEQVKIAEDGTHSTKDQAKIVEDGTQSVKEQARIAEEKQQKDENNKPESGPDEPSSPPLPVSKGVYTIDFDKLDEFNPFAMTGGLQISPVSSANENMRNSVPDPEEVKGDDEERKESNTSLSEFQSVKDNPFIRLIESPAIKEKKTEHVVDAIVAEQSDDIFSQKFEDIDPFQPRKQLTNSPEVPRKTNSADDEVTVVPTDSPKNHIEPRELNVNSDTCDEQNLCNTDDNTQSASRCVDDSEVLTQKIQDDTSESQIKEKKDLGFTDFDENMDPFATKTNVMNTPPKMTNNTTDLLANKTMNSPVMPSDGSADLDVAKSEMTKSESKIANSPTKENSELDSDPLATQCKVANSPAKDNFTENVDPFATNAKVANSPVKNTFTENPDPFATNAKVANSPVKDTLTEIVDPFATKTKVANSPVKDTSTENVDPFATKTKVANSPVKDTLTENPDPFATNAKVANSPVKNTSTENVDPFATKTKVANSPVKDTSTENPDPFATKAKVANSPVKDTLTENVDPFATKAKVANSPVKNTSIENVDPFATKAKVANSPVKDTLTENVDPFATNAKVANSPVSRNVKEDEDPFATKTKVADSPVRKFEEEFDPFATKSKIASSPSEKASEKIHPLETQTEAANVPLGVLDLDSLDPFAAKLNVENSPHWCEKLAEETIKQSKDLGDAQSEVGVSASKSMEESTFEKLGKNNLNEHLIDSKECASPFSGQIENKIQNSPFKLQDDPFRTPTSVVKKTPKKSHPFTMGEFGLSDEDFKPASSTLFNDPADFDALEQFGCNKGIAESALSRMSLYVKFDPLVDLPVADPRRASIDVRRMSVKRGKLRNLEAEESILLMGTPPHGVPQSRVVPVVKNQTPVNTKPDTTDAAAPVDLLFSNTPKTDIGDVIKDTLSLNQPEGDGIIEVLQYTEADICRIKQNLAMEFQGILLDNQKEWSKKIEEKEAEVGKIREQHQKGEEDIKQMISVVKEYEIMINQLVEEREKLNKQLTESKQELQQAKEKSSEYAQSMETIEGLFSALHTRYDKSREVLEHAKKNEDTLKSCLEECQSKLKQSDERFHKLKQVAEEKLKASHEELEAVKSKSASETARLQAVVKRKEIQRETLEKSLEQKTKEFQDVTELCDQLMQKLESQ